MQEALTNANGNAGEEIPVNVGNQVSRNVKGVGLKIPSNIAPSHVFQSTSGRNKSMHVYSSDQITEMAAIRGSEAM